MSANVLSSTKACNRCLSDRGKGSTSKIMVLANTKSCDLHAQANTSRAAAMMPLATPCILLACRNPSRGLEFP
ncbi:hypothetical protein MRB53_039633 [Persea americana]|nr:hypothetical protein MRB53_039633 [Persea americana]